MNMACDECALLGKSNVYLSVYSMHTKIELVLIFFMSSLVTHPYYLPAVWTTRML